MGNVFELLALMLHAGESLKINEQLVPTRGRCSFCEHMSGKPRKYAGGEVFSRLPTVQYARYRSVYYFCGVDGIVDDSVFLSLINSVAMQCPVALFFIVD